MDNEKYETDKGIKRKEAALSKIRKELGVTPSKKRKVCVRTVKERSSIRAVGAVDIWLTVLLLRLFSEWEKMK